MADESILDEAITRNDRSDEGPRAQTPLATQMGAIGGIGDTD